MLGEDREQLLSYGNQVVAANSQDADIADDILRDSRTVTFSSFVPLWIFLMDEDKNVSFLLLFILTNYYC